MVFLPLIGSFGSLNFLNCCCYLRADLLTYLSNHFLTHVCKPHTEVCLLNSTLSASLVLEGHKNQTVDVKTVCLNIVVDHRHCLQIDPNTLEVCFVQSSQQQQQHSESRGAQLCLYSSPGLKLHNPKW